MRRLPVALVLALALLGLFAAPATAAFDLRDLDVTFEAEDGSPELRAGAHPFAMSTTVGVSTEETPEGAVPEGELRDLEIMQIPGLIGSQTAVPRCNDAEFAQIVKGRPACPDETAVGYSAAEVEFKVIPPDQAGNFFHMPVYNLDPPPGAAARLGLIVLNVPVTIDLTLSRSHPYKLRAELNEIPQAILFYRSKVTLWGYPADPAHDSLRGNCLGIVNEPTPEPVSLGDCPVPLGTPEEAFLTLPRSCGEPLQTLFSATSWLGELAVGAALTHDESGPAGIEDCGGLPFDADAEARPTSASAASPTGLDFGIEVEDEGLIDPDERAQADVSRVEVSLPEGMAINPAAANGLEACTPAQFKAEGPDWNPDAGCPQASKLGTVEAQSPLLDEALGGELYVAAQNDNPFNSLFALYLVIRSERYGIVVKQAGRVDPDPATGQLRSTFAELPQLPFSELRVRFREGPRAPLTTSVSCGTHTATTTLTPSSGAAAIVDSSGFQITSGPDGGPCPTSPLPFAPGLTGGATDTRAGAYSPFYMRLTRGDAEQEITRFEAVLPPGVLGKIPGVGRCSDAQIAAAEAAAGRAELTAPSCPASSRIGSVQAGAGVGPFPTYVDGALYLAGPYAGAPLSVAAVVPAVTGPFDLGTVVVREALQLNPDTGQAEVKAGESIPRILEGVPLQLRDLRIALDRPGFTLNATSCDPEELKADVFGTSSQASVVDRYQATGCRDLRFRPKLTLKLKGGTKRGQFPAVRSVLRPRAGDANVGKAVVILPPSQQIENAHINNPCTRVQFAAEACPKKSILGKAKAWTPLLDEPLEGNVYFRSNGGERELPDLVADLRGQFRIVLVGFIDTRGRRIRTTFANVPDAPVSKFALNLFGGKRGLLVNNRDLCKGKKKLRTMLRLTGQNGRPYEANPVLKTSCKKGGKGKGGKKGR